MSQPAACTYHFIEINVGVELYLVSFGVSFRIYYKFCQSGVQNNECFFTKQVTALFVGKPGSAKLLEIFPYLFANWQLAERNFLKLKNPHLCLELNSGI